MQNLPKDDQTHLEAARAWLELSGANILEATEELESINPLLRSHPEVLKTRIAIYLAAGKKDEAAIVADHLARVYNERGKN